MSRSCERSTVVPPPTPQPPNPVFRSLTAATNHSGPSSDVTRRAFESRGEMAPLGKTDLTTAAVSGNGVAARGQYSTSPRGGKRPRTTSSIFAAAATGMLKGPKPEAGSHEPPSPLAKLKDTGPDYFQPEALFRLRRHAESKRDSVPVPAVDGPSKPAKKAVSVDRSAVNPLDPASFERSTTDREDAFGEAEAMAADEGRISPPSPIITRSLDHLQPSEIRRTQRSEHRMFGKATESERSLDAIFCGTSEREGVNRRPAMAAAHINNLFIRDDHGQSAPTAPAFEPPPSPIRKTAAEEQHASGPETSRKVAPGIATEVGHEQRHDFATPFGARGFRVPRRDVCSRTASLPTPQTQFEEDGDKRLGGIDGDICQEEGQQQPLVTLSSTRREIPSSPEFDRKNFLSAVARSDVSYKSVREDLLQYMEGVRARWVELLR